MTVIETPRLLLREFTSDDLNPLAALYADPDVMRFSLKGPLSVAEAQQVLEHFMRGYAENGFGLWAVVPKADQQVIGYCGLSWQPLEGERVVEVGYRLSPAYWGQGIATEAAQATLKYAFEQCGLRRVFAFIDPQNIGSIRVAEKSGMHYLKDSHLHHLPIRVYLREQ